MKCRNCLREYKVNAKYCPYCGLQNPKYYEKIYIEELDNTENDSERNKAPNVRRINLSANFMEDGNKDNPNIRSSNLDNLKNKPYLNQKNQISNKNDNKDIENSVYDVVQNSEKTNKTNDLENTKKFTRGEMNRLNNAEDRSLDNSTDHYLTNDNNTQKSQDKTSSKPSKLGLAFGSIIKSFSNMSQDTNANPSDKSEDKILNDSELINSDNNNRNEDRKSNIYRASYHNVDKQREYSDIITSDNKWANDNDKVRPNVNHIDNEDVIYSKNAINEDQANKTSKSANTINSAKTVPVVKPAIEAKERNIAKIEANEKDKYAEYIRQSLNYDRYKAKTNARDNRATLHENSNKMNKTNEANSNFDQADIDDQNNSSSWFKNAIEWVLIRIRPIHVVIILAIISLLIATFIIRGLGSPIKPFDKALNSRNYEQAGEFYQNYLSNDKKADLAETSLKEHLDTLKQNAIDGKATYPATYSALESIKKSKLYQDDAVAILDKSYEEILNLQKIDINYQNGLDYQKKLDFANAINEYNKVKTSYPDYRDVSSRLVEIREKYRDQVLRSISILQSQGNYAQADADIDAALKLLPEDPILLNLKQDNANRFESALYQETKNKVEKHFKAGKYQEIFNTINSAIDKEKNNEALLTLKKVYESKCSESILNTADSIFNQGDKEAALKKIEEGLKLLPENKALQEAKDRYELKEDDLSNIDKKPTDENNENVDDGLDRGTHNDAAGEAHSNAVNVHHQFDGNTNVVDRVKFKNVKSSDVFKGELLIGEVDAYTQVYYQVYSSSNLSKPILAGSLYADKDGEVGSNYKIDINATAAGADYFVVNINYLKGNNINVVLDLGYSG